MSMNCLLSLDEGNVVSWDDRGQIGLAVVDCLGFFCLGNRVPRMQYAMYDVIRIQSL